jgi:tetratricopeptide (TPR) repeat protein
MASVSTEKILLLFDEVRPVLGDAGIVDLSPSALDAAMAVHGVALAAPVPGGWAWDEPFTLSVPDAHGVRWLRLRPGLDPVLQTVCKALAMADGTGSAGRACAEMDRQAFACALAIPHYVCVHHPAERNRRIQLLDGEPALWTRGLGTVLDRVEDILQRVSARAGSKAFGAEDDARAAYLLGVQAREDGRFDEAEALFSRGAARAQDAQAWEPLALCHAGLGRTAWERGFHAEARRAFKAAEDVCRRHELRGLRARMLHWRFSVEATHGDARDATRLAASAIRAYPARDPHLLAFAHDLSVFWMDQGFFARAFVVLQAAAARGSSCAAERLLMWANLARAAGGQGDRLAYDDAVASALAEESRVPTDSCVAAARVALARGACSLSRWDEGENHARHALTVAFERGETAVACEAKGVTENAVRHRRLDRGARFGEDSGDDLAYEVAEAVQAA